MPWGETSADPSKFEEAVQSHLKRVVMTPAQAHQLDERARQEAFWVGGGLQLAQIQRVFDALSASIEKGETFADFKARIRGDLAKPAHVETVFRNAVQRAYNTGRWHQMREPSTLKFRPFWLFDTINDSRRTPLCRACHGTLLPADHPWWDTHLCPLHHRCRSSIRNLRRAEAEKRGITQTPNADPVPAGWGLSPRLNAGPPKPQPAKTDAALLSELEQKAAAGGAKKRKPRTPKEHEAKHWLTQYEPRYGDAAPSLARGRAAYERGLDMKVSAARELLRKVDTAGFTAMRDALQDADANRTLREQGGELDPLRKAAAAAAGHLQMLGTRPSVQHAALAAMPGGQRALDTMGQLTGAGVKHPGEAWTFQLVKGGADANAFLQRVRYDPALQGALEHELGHVVEDLNPGLFARAKAFLKARARGEARTKYKGVPVWRDSFLHPYTGRDYRHTKGSTKGLVYGTEATSTALELLVANRAHWGSLEQLAQKDFEHLLFLFGQLAGP